MFLSQIKIVEESEEFKKTTPAINKKRFKTLEKELKSNNKKSRIEVNLAFDSLKKQHSKRTVLSKNHGSIKSLHSLQLFDKDVHSSKYKYLYLVDENKIEKQRSITNIEMYAKAPDDVKEIGEANELNPDEIKEEGKK